MDTTKFDQVTKEYSVAQLILDTHIRSLTVTQLTFKYISSRVG